MNREEEHHQRELRETISGLKEVVADLTGGEGILVRLARIEERLGAHAHLIAALGGAIGIICGALAVALAD